jgi:hypothetical protein
MGSARRAGQSCDAQALATYWDTMRGVLKKEPLKDKGKMELAEGVEPPTL